VRRTECLDVDMVDSRLALLLVHGSAVCFTVRMPTSVFAASAQVVLRSKQPICSAEEITKVEPEETAKAKLAAALDISESKRHALQQQLFESENAQASLSEQLSTAKLQRSGDAALESIRDERDSMLEERDVLEAMVDTLDDRLHAAMMQIEEGASRDMQTRQQHVQHTSELIDEIECLKEQVRASDERYRQSLHEVMRLQDEVQQLEAMLTAESQSSWSHAPIQWDRLRTLVTGLPTMLISSGASLMAKAAGAFAVLSQGALVGRFTAEIYRRRAYQALVTTLSLLMPATLMSTGMPNMTLSKFARPRQDLEVPPPKADDYSRPRRKARHDAYKLIEQLA